MVFVKYVFRYMLPCRMVDILFVLTISAIAFYIRRWYVVSFFRRLVALVFSPSLLRCCFLGVKVLACLIFLLAVSIFPHRMFAYFVICTMRLTSMWK